MNIGLLIRAVFRRIFGAVFSHLPLQKNSVVFDNFNGGGFGCNPKYIAEALADDGFRIVWLVRDISEVFPSYVTPVKYDSLRAWYQLATAKVFVSNVRNSKGIRKRSGQKWIQTWHASLGPKMIEKDAQGSLSPQYLKDAMLNGKNTDLMFANNALMENVFRSSFWYSGDIIRCGVPRNRPLIVEDEQSKIRIRRQLGIEKGSLVCLFAPTWRNGDTKIPMFDVSSCIGVLESTHNKNVVFCIRFHPNTDRSQYHLPSNVVDVSGFSDTQELLSVTDVLISDYSSIIEDFVFTGRPAYMFVPDYDDYIKDRQFYYPLTDRPYPTCKSEEELLRAIRNYSEGELRNRVRFFKQKFGIEDDGEGSVIIADTIRKWLTE